MDPVKGRLFSKQMQSATLPKFRDMIIVGSGVLELPQLLLAYETSEILIPPTRNCLVQWARVELAVLVAAGLQPTGVTNFPTIA